MESGSSGAGLSPGGFKGSQSGSCTDGSALAVGFGPIPLDSRHQGSSVGPGMAPRGTGVTQGRWWLLLKRQRCRWMGSGVFPGTGVGVFPGILPFQRSPRCSAFDAGAPSWSSAWRCTQEGIHPSRAVGWWQEQHSQLPFPFPDFCRSERAFCHVGRGNGLGLPNLCQQSPGDAT